MVEEPPTRNVAGDEKAKIGDLSSLDLDSLVEQARSSEDHEAYHVVAAREHFRIGLVAESAHDMSVTFRIEVLVRVLANDTRPKVTDLQRANVVLDSLSRRGYSLTHHDGCWVSCERAVATDDIEDERLAVMEIIQPEKDVRCMEVSE